MDDMKENSAGKGETQKKQIIRKEKRLIISAFHGGANNLGSYELHHASMSHISIYFLD